MIPQINSFCLRDKNTKPAVKRVFDIQNCSGKLMVIALPVKICMMPASLGYPYFTSSFTLQRPDGNSFLVWPQCPVMFNRKDFRIKLAINFLNLKFAASPIMTIINLAFINIIIIPVIISILCKGKRNNAQANYKCNNLFHSNHFLWFKNCSIVEIVFLGISKTTKC